MSSKCDVYETLDKSRTNTDIDLANAYIKVWRKENKDGKNL